MSVLLTAVWIFFFVNTMKRKSGTHFQRCGPMYMLTAAVPLILADNLRHILQDRNIWNACDRRDGIIWDSRRCLWASNQYECTLPGPDHCLPDKDEKMSHLSFVGVLFTVVFMYSGFVCLIGSILWYVRVDKKVVIIKDKCKQVYALYQKNKEKKARLAEQKAEKDSGSKELLNPLVSKSEINN